MAEQLDIQENEMAIDNKAPYLRGVASNGNSILVDVQAFKSTEYQFVREGVSGGEPTTWVGIGTFQNDPYFPTRINLSFGNYHLPTTRKIIDVTFSGYNASLYKAGNGENVIGYVLRDNNIMDLYIKMQATQIAIGWVYGLGRKYLGSTTSEPSGIVYVP